MRGAAWVPLAPRRACADPTRRQPQHVEQRSSPACHRMRTPPCTAAAPRPPRGFRWAARRGGTLGGRAARHMLRQGRPGPGRAAAAWSAPGRRGAGGAARPLLHASGCAPASAPLPTVAASGASVADSLMGGRLGSSRSAAALSSATSKSQDDTPCAHARPPLRSAVTWRAGVPPPHPGTASCAEQHAPACAVRRGCAWHRPGNTERRRQAARLDVRLLAGLHLEPLVGGRVGAGGRAALPHLVHARGHVRQARQQVLHQVGRVVRRLRARRVDVCMRSRARPVAEPVVRSGMRAPGGGPWQQKRNGESKKAKRHPCRGLIPGPPGESRIF